MASKFRPEAEKIMSALWKLQDEIRQERQLHELQPSLLIFENNDQTKTLWSDIYEKPRSYSPGWDTTCEIIGLLKNGYKFSAVIQNFDEEFTVFTDDSTFHDRFDEAGALNLLKTAADLRNAAHA